MLVLSRKRDERIIAHADIAKLKEFIAAAEASGATRVQLLSIQVVKIAGPLVRLGLDAPDEVDLVREEVFLEQQTQCPSE